MSRQVVIPADTAQRLHSARIRNWQVEDGSLMSQTHIHAEHVPHASGPKPRVGSTFQNRKSLSLWELRTLRPCDYFVTMEQIREYASRQRRNTPGFVLVL